jgi:hypothetical protein
MVVDELPNHISWLKTSIHLAFGRLSSLPSPAYLISMYMLTPKIMCSNAQLGPLYHLVNDCGKQYGNLLVHHLMHITISIIDMIRTVWGG